MRGSKTTLLGWESKFLLYSCGSLFLLRTLALGLHRRPGTIAYRTLRTAKAPSNQRITQINIKFFYLKRGNQLLLIVKDFFSKKLLMRCEGINQAAHKC